MNKVIRFLLRNTPIIAAFYWTSKEDLICHDTTDYIIDRDYDKAFNAYQEYRQVVYKMCLHTNIAVGIAAIISIAASC